MSSDIVECYNCQQRNEESDDHCFKCGADLELNRLTYRVITQSGNIEISLGMIVEGYKGKRFDNNTKVRIESTREWVPISEHSDLLQLLAKYYRGVHHSQDKMGQMKRLADCIQCGHKVSLRATECPKCGQILKSQCFVCDNSIPFDAEQCPECGDPEPFIDRTEPLEKTTTCPKCGILRKTECDLCGSCNEPLPKDLYMKKTVLKACQGCSHSISEDALSCPKCTTKTSQPCEICGESIAVWSEVCPECGDPEPFQSKYKDQLATATTNVSTPKSEPVEKEVHPTKSIESIVQLTEVNDKREKSIHSPEKRKSRSVGMKYFLSFIITTVIMIIGVVGYSLVAGSVPEANIFIGGSGLIIFFYSYYLLGQTWEEYEAK